MKTAVFGNNNGINHKCEICDRVEKREMAYTFWERNGKYYCNEHFSPEFVK